MRGRCECGDWFSMASGVCRGRLSSAAPVVKGTCALGMQVPLDETREAPCVHEMEDGPETPDDFAVGEVVDVQDTVKLWSEAEVVEIDHDARKVLISYLFWSNRYNEWIDFASEARAGFAGRVARRAPP